MRSVVFQSVHKIFEKSTEIMQDKKEREDKNDFIFKTFIFEQKRIFFFYIFRLLFSLFLLQRSGIFFFVFTFSEVVSCLISGIFFVIEGD